MPELLDGFDGSTKDEKASNIGPAGIDIPTTALGKESLTRMATPGTPLSFSDVLRLRPVRRLWIAQIVSVFGDFLAVFAIIAVVTFKLHGTATQMAMVLTRFVLLLMAKLPESCSISRISAGFEFSVGGKPRAQRYSTEQLSAWAKLGGRPKGSGKTQ